MERPQAPTAPNSPGHPALASLLSTGHLPGTIWVSSGQEELPGATGSVPPRAKSQDPCSRRWDPMSRYCKERGGLTVQIHSEHPKRQWGAGPRGRVDEDGLARGNTGAKAKRCGTPQMPPAAKHGDRDPGQEGEEGRHQRGPKRIPVQADQGQHWERPLWLQGGDRCVTATAGDKDSVSPLRTLKPAMSQL